MSTMSYFVFACLLLANLVAFVCNGSLIGFGAAIAMSAGLVSIINTDRRVNDILGRTEGVLA